jgi:hypothetical protein
MLMDWSAWKRGIAVMLAVVAAAIAMFAVVSLGESGRLGSPQGTLSSGAPVVTAALRDVKQVRTVFGAVEPIVAVAGPVERVVRGGAGGLAVNSWPVLVGGLVVSTVLVVGSVTGRVDDGSNSLRWRLRRSSVSLRAPPASLLG